MYQTHRLEECQQELELKEVREAHFHKHQDFKEINGLTAILHALFSPWSVRLIVFLSMSQ